MKCDRCNNQANHFLSYSVNGVTEEFNLCSECYRQQESGNKFLSELSSNVDLWDVENIINQTFQQLLPNRQLLKEQENDSVQLVLEQDITTEEIKPSLEVKLKEAIAKEDYLEAARLKNLIEKGEEYDH